MRTRRGFPFGGWQVPLLNEVIWAQVAAGYEGTDALLLGRRTYDAMVTAHGGSKTRVPQI